MASWYGAQFHGRPTASGERFDRTDLTAAHRSLPFGSRVCVRSSVTGKTVVVRINDRGPFAPGRVIDLSQAAAEELGMVGLGIKPVELWKLGADGENCSDEAIDAAVDAAVAKSSRQGSRQVSAARKPHAKAKTQAKAQPRQKTTPRARKR